MSLNYSLWWKCLDTSSSLKTVCFPLYVSVMPQTHNFGNLHCSLCCGSRLILYCGVYYVVTNYNKDM